MLIHTPLSNLKIYMITFNDLEKLRDKEVKEYLKNNNYYKPGALLVYKEIDYRDNQIPIFKFVTYSNTDKTCFFYKDEYKDVRSGKNEEFQLLTYDVFKKIKNDKNEYKNPFKTVENVITFFKKSLSRVFSEDSFDVAVSVYRSNHINVTIYYPELEITNSLDTSHKIRELYVIFIFDFSGISLQLVNIELFRSAFTPSEVYSNYIHSHYNGYISERQLGKSICWGNTPIKMYLSKIKHIFNPKDLVFLITQVHNYLKWESIEGVPYKKINELKKFIIKNNLIDISELNNIKEFCYKFVLNNLENFNYTFIPKNYGDYKIELKEDTKLLITNLLIKYFKKEYGDEGGLLVRKIGNDYGDITTLDIEFLKETGYGLGLTMARETINFKGEAIKPKIIEDPEKTSIEEIEKAYPITIHPDILKYVISNIENKFLDYFIKTRL